jgi:predicted metal-dependent phosphoesterase TrpH
MLDMHIHTSYSDGMSSVRKILKSANDLNISTLSITDHNTILAYEEIIKNNLIKSYNGNLVSGVELKCHINKEIIELLVYDFNIYKMKKFIEDNYHKWEYINRSMSAEFESILIKLGILYDKNIMISHDFNKYDGIMELYKSVIEINSNKKILGDDLNENIPEFFRKCVCDSMNRFYVDLSKYYPSIEDIISFVKSNEGKIFMPHVYLFNNGYNILKQIKKSIDGVECYHPSYTMEQCNELLDYCSHNNLYISAGSDYHGINYELCNISKYYDDSKIKLFEFKYQLNRK